MSDSPSRSKNHRLAAVRSKDTKPEMMLRRALWAEGFRYRLHAKGLPGRPDLAFPRFKVAVFVDGDFWHGYDWENLRPKLKSEFWVRKITRNMERDREQTVALEEMGWAVVRIWEHEVKGDLEECVSRVRAALADREVGP